MNKIGLFLGLILSLSVICGTEGCAPDETWTQNDSNNSIVYFNDSIIPLNNSIPLVNDSVISLNQSASVLEIQEKAKQKLQENICNLLPAQASRLPGDLLRVGVKAPDNIENGMTIEFPSYYLMAYNNETYYNCFVFGQETSTGPKECLIPFTADLMDENNDKITDVIGAVKMTFEGPLEALKDNPDYIQPTQDGPAPKNLQALTKRITPTFTRTGCELQIDKPCEVPEGYSFCGKCSYSVISSDQVSYRGQCAICPPGTSCSNGNNNSKFCAGFSCISNTQNTNTPVTKQQTYFASCSNCQGLYRSYNYNAPDYSTCNYYSRLCTQNQCLDKRTNCG